MTEARKRAAPCEFLEAFAQTLLAAGVDVARVTTGVPILHPQIFSFSGLWQAGSGATERLFRLEAFAIMTNSPIRIAYDGGGPYRCNLTEPAKVDEFPILA